MNLAVIRGNYLDPWEMEFYSKMKHFGVFPTGICSNDNLFETSNMDMPIKRLKNVREANKIPLVRGIIGGLFCVNNGLIGLKDAVKDADVINVTELYNTYSYQAVRMDKPVVITCWETMAFNNERTMYKHFKKEVRNKAKHFIAISEKAKRALIKEGVDESKISVIPAGLDTDRFKPLPKDKKMLESLNISPNKKVVLFVGRLEKEKGILELVDAMTGINAVLLIAGSGPLKDEVLLKAKKNNVDLKFLGFVPYSRMHFVHNLADIFCLPSIPNKKWEEQFGYVLVEAMGCSKPVVSTTSGAIPEVVNDERVLVSPGNVPGLHHIIKTILENDDLRKRLGEKNRERVETVFKDSVVAKKLADVFNSVHKH